ncbi:uncharacterized protein [Periplaneta americana]|uniref:uncharacterized protein n=1 Tax=Periplaneta americana TaxID=6978 RepID=UPI0037E78302
MVTLECVKTVPLVPLALILIGQSFCQVDNNLPILSRQLRYVIFPDKSTMGLYLATAIPLEASNYDVSMAWNIEAHYHLPTNYTELVLPFIVSGVARSEREINRRRAYQFTEEKFNSYGLDGRECLLRTICETSESSIRHNGLLGDILHIIFTPSSSADENLHPDFPLAEKRGKSGSDCRISYPKCPIALFDIIAPFID